MDTKYFNPKTVKPGAIPERGIQPKLEVNPPNDIYEKQADEVADRVSRMPANPSDNLQMQPKEDEEKKLQMKSEDEDKNLQMKPEEEDKKLQMKPEDEDKKLQMKPKEDESVSMKPEEEEKGKIQMSAGSSSNNQVPQVSSSLASQLQSTKGQGSLLSEGVSQEMGQKIVGDFSNVRVHTDDNAVQMNKEFGSKAFTHGNDIYFNSGKYNPESTSGKHLLSHELTHTVQQGESSPVSMLRKLQRKGLSVQRTPITIAGRQFMEGDIIVNNSASRDIRTYGNLLPSVDQSHIAVTSNRKLAYEISYTNPEDPFRWNIVKSMIDNEHVEIYGVSIADTFNTKLVKFSQGNRTEIVMPVSLISFMASGMTLPTEAKQLTIDPQNTHIVASTSSTYHQVYYETGKSGRGLIGGNALAHELFGHLWLALQNAPFGHGKSLAATTNINDPLGRRFTGSVDDFIDKFAGASSISIMQSPTLRVSPQFLLSTLQWIVQNGASHISTQGNGSIDADLDKQWQYLSNNYDILRTNSQGVNVAANTTLTTSNVETQIVQWVNGLPSDKKTVFKNVLIAITGTFGIRRRGLSNAIITQI